MVNSFYNLYNKMNRIHKVFNISNLVNYINKFMDNVIHFNDLISLDNGIHIFYNTLILDNTVTIKPKLTSKFIKNKLQHISKCIINYDNTNNKKIISSVLSLTQ